MTMPQGEFGLDTGSWGAEWVNTNDASLFGDRTRGVIETHYKTSLSTTDPWVAARDALFTTLMAGFNNLSEFITDLAAAISGAVGGGLANIASFMTGIVGSISQLFTRLFDAAGNFIADIGKGIVDGVKSMGEFLGGLWDTLTGNTGTPSTGKTVANVTDKLGLTYQNTNSALSGAQQANTNLGTTWNDLYDAFGGTTGSVNRSSADVRGRGVAVRSSAINGETISAAQNAAGSNVVSNPGFESTAIYAGTGSWYTPIKRTGAQSRKLTGAGAEVALFLTTNTTAVTTIPCVALDTYYGEIYVRGDSANNQTTGGTNGIGLYAAILKSDGSYSYQSFATLTASTALNGAWTKLSGNILVPSFSGGVYPVSVYFYCALSAAVPATQIYYFDDPVVRETTAASSASAKAVAAQGDVVTISDGAYNAWYGAGGAGSSAQVSGTISAIKTAIAGGWTVEVLTTSGTWTRPVAVAQMLDFWAICIGGGGGGGKGGTGTSAATSYGGGAGGLGGGYVAQQINPSSLTDTVSYTIGSGGSGGTTTSSTTGTASTFGSLATSVSGSSTASISSLFGYYDAVSSAPGDGGAGGKSSPSATSGSTGGSTPLAAGGVGAFNAVGGNGGTALLTGQSRAGGGGAGGGGGLSGGVGFAGGVGGFPGGGGGGGAGVNSSLTAQTGGAGGVGANGVIVLLYKKAV